MKQKVIGLNPTDKYAKYNLAALANNRKRLNMEEFKKLTKVYYV